MPEQNGGEAVTLEILRLIFSSFWTFAGSWLFFTVTVRTLFLCWNRFLRHLSVRSRGWPPSHLDADGDWKPEKEES